MTLSATTHFLISPVPECTSILFYPIQFNSTGEALAELDFHSTNELPYMFLHLGAHNTPVGWMIDLIALAGFSSFCLFIFVPDRIRDDHMYQSQ